MQENVWIKEKKRGKYLTLVSIVKYMFSSEVLKCQIKIIADTFMKQLKREQEVNFLEKQS